MFGAPYGAPLFIGVRSFFVALCYHIVVFYRLQESRKEKVMLQILVVEGRMA